MAYSAFGPLSGGWLTGKYRRDAPFPSGSRMTQRPEPYAQLISDRTFDALDRLAEIGRERRSSMAGVALAWLLADDRVTQIVVGPGRPEHLEPVREALAQPLAADERARLEEAFGGPPEALHRKWRLRMTVMLRPRTLAQRSCHHRPGRRCRGPASLPGGPRTSPFPVQRFRETHP